jgi:hypothetical protein
MAIRAFHRLSQFLQFVLAFLQRRKRADKLAVLLLYFGKDHVIGQCGEQRAEGSDLFGRDDWRIGRDCLLQQDGGAYPLLGGDDSLFHQSARPEDPKAQPGRRAVLAGQHQVKVADARPLVFDPDHQRLWHGVAGEREFNPACMGILERIARQLGNSRGYFYLILRPEAA